MAYQQSSSSSANPHILLDDAFMSGLRIKQHFLFWWMAELLAWNYYIVFSSASLQWLKNINCLGIDYYVFAVEEAKTDCRFNGQLSLKMYRIPSVSLQDPYVNNYMMTPRGLILLFETETPEARPSVREVLRNTVLLQSYNYKGH